MEKIMEKEQYRSFCEVYNDPNYWVGAGLSNYYDYHPDYFEKRWKNYFISLVKSWLEMLKDDAKTVRTVLCCGDAFGFTVTTLREMGYLAIGFDVSRYAVANQIAPMFLHNLIDPIPLPPHSFDLVTASDVLEHIPENLLPEVLENIARVTGRFFIARLPYANPADGEATHLTLTSRNWWAKLFERYFKPLRIMTHGEDQFIMERKPDG